MRKQAMHIELVGNVLQNSHLEHRESDGKLRFWWTLEEKVAKVGGVAYGTGAGSWQLTGFGIGRDEPSSLIARTLVSLQSNVSVS